MLGGPPQRRLPAPPRLCRNLYQGGRDSGLRSQYHRPADCQRLRRFGIKFHRESKVRKAKAAEYWLPRNLGQSAHGLPGRTAPAPRLGPAPKRAHRVTLSEMRRRLVVGGAYHAHGGRTRSKHSLHRLRVLARLANALRTSPSTHSAPASHSAKTIGGYGACTLVPPRNTDQITRAE